MPSVQSVVTRFKQAKNEGEKTRDTLRNIGIHLNNLAHNQKFQKGLTPEDFRNVKEDVQEHLDSITKVLFGVHVPEIKKYIADEVIGALKLAIDLANSQNEPDDLRQAIYVAYDRLKSAVDMLADNPDNDEVKQMLSRELYMLLPRDNSDEVRYERAIKLSKQLAESEKGNKAKAFYKELSAGLQAALDGHLELRRAAAFAFKMLPKAK